MSRSWWMRWTRMGDALTPTAPPGTSFAWPDVPRDTDLTREQIEIAMRGAAAAPGSQPDAGPLPVATTASVAPRLNDDEAAAIRSRPWAYSEEDVAAAWIERAQPGSTPILGGIVGTQDADGSSVVWSDGPAMYGHGETPGAAMRDYAESVAALRNPDAFDSKTAIREQQAHAMRVPPRTTEDRGDCGDGHEPPPDYEVWAR